MTNAPDLPTLSDSPSLAPDSFAGMLQEADALLAEMDSEPLGTVADLAETLIARASNAGAREIADAALAVSRVASRSQGAVLAVAMRDLRSAIAQAHLVHLDRRA